MESESYRICKGAGAFFQGGHDSNSGWILIEFWKPSGADSFVAYVNSELAKMGIINT